MIYVVVARIASKDYEMVVVLDVFNYLEDDDAERAVNLVFHLLDLIHYYVVEDNCGMARVFTDDG